MQSLIIAEYTCNMILFVFFFQNSIGEWLNPAHQVTIQQTPDRLTESLPTGTQNDGIKREGLVSAPFCYALLRERARRK